MGFENLTRPPLSPAERQAMPPPADVLVEDSYLEEYLKLNHGYLLVLDNNMHLVTFAREAIDSKEISTMLSVPYHPFRDLLSGKTHFTEHFFGSSSELASNQLDVSQNASTSWNQLCYSAYGDAIPGVSEFGLFPFIPNMLNTLSDPFQDIKDPEKIFNGQKQRIITELNQYDYQHDHRVNRALSAFYFNPDNPRASIDKVYGTPEDIALITLEEVKQHAARILIPSRAVMQILAEGSLEEAILFTNELGSAFSKYPRRQEYENDLPIEQQESMNPDFHDGAVFLHDTGIPNHQVTIQYAWPIDMQPDSPEDVSLAEFRWLAHKAANRASEANGWGYNVGAYVDNEAGNKAIFYARVKITTVGIDGEKGRDPITYAAQLMNEMREQVLMTNDEDIVDNNTRQKLMRAYVPILQQARLNLATRGIHQYHKIIDADKRSGLKDQITPEDVIYWRDQLCERTPAVAIIGDLR